MAVYANWVHGSMVQPQRQGFFVNTVRAGYGARFLSHNEPGKGGEWFHIGVPSPVLVAGKRSKVVKVLLRYSTIQTAKITAVHFYDGESQFKALAKLSLSSSTDALADWAVSPAHEMKWGLGLSVFVDFGHAAAQGVPGVWFRSVGADFDVV